MDFKSRLTGAATQTENMLDRLLPSPANAGREALLLDAMRYATLGGGKRLRAFFAIESAALFDLPKGYGERVAAAVECLHAYSLIHDDLPAMDDDALRRGKPTTHIKYDEATAILAGDALQTLAFEILGLPETHPEPTVRLALIQKLAKASGPGGMVGGQAIDVAAETAGANPLYIEEITRLQSMKTGALIEFSCVAGSLLAQAKPAEIKALENYARDIGLAFQIQDDILDVEGTTEATGKKVGKDAHAGKATFVSLLGLDNAKARAQELVINAKNHLSPFGSRSQPLRDAAEFVIARSS